jgi:hypothetical protein
MKADVPNCLDLEPDDCVAKVRAAGFDQVSTVVETTPDYGHAPGVVLATDPESGENVDRGTEIAIHTNPQPADVTERSDRDREDCEISPHVTYPPGNRYDEVDRFYAYDQEDPVLLRRGDIPWFGRDHIAFGHGWAQPERDLVSAAHTAPEYAPAEGELGPNPLRLGTTSTYHYYYPWISLNGHTHCTMMVIVN